jgi:hypothetical protein
VREHLGRGGLPDPRHADGTKTYFFAATDIQRGIDIFSWTDLPTPVRAGGKPGKGGGKATTADAGLLALALVELPAAALIGRRRRRG